MGVVKKIISPSPAPAPAPAPAPVISPAEPSLPDAAADTASTATGSRRRVSGTRRRGGTGVRILFSRTDVDPAEQMKNVLGSGIKL